MPPATKEPTASHSRPFEESLLRAIDKPSLRAPEELGRALAMATGARRVLLYRLRSNEPQPVAQVEDGAVCRLQDNFNCDLLDFAGLASQPSSEWFILDHPHESWRAGIKVDWPPGHECGVLLEGCGPCPSPTTLTETADSNHLAGLIALASAIESLKPGNTEPPDKAEAGPCPPRPSAKPAGARGLLLEFPLGGDPPIMATSQALGAFPEIVTRSSIMAGILQSVLLAAKSDIPVLIEGESGTGKELVARAIHRVSRRAGRPFLCENCGALPENLVESEFFGHERGAFTGADQARAGIFERAGGGTVFLDEVGEMEIALQRKLLRVLQEREVRRLGGQKTVTVDFRLVSATNRVLEEMVARGQFREDLFYRLEVTTIHMPPLRERPEDVPLLLLHFARLFAEDTGRDPVTFTEAALEMLASHPWPGNVRELQNEVWRHACSERAVVDVEQLSRRISRGNVRSRGGWALTPRSLQELERNTIAPMLVEALRRSGGNRSEAARLLGISRTVLYRRLKRYRLLDNESLSNRVRL